MYFSFSILGRSISIKFYNEKVISFSILIARKPDKETYGITSRCYGGQHVIFLDYDGLKMEEIEEEIMFLIKEFHLSDFYIFENDRPDSYHAICLDKFNLYEAIDIISRTSADKGFKIAPILFKQKRWVLRVLPKGKRKKPKFYGIIQSAFNSLEISTAHKIFLEINYNLKIKKYKYEDGVKDFVEVCKYNTGANV